MFKKILVAIDGSKMSDKALETAVNMAKEKGSSVTIIHVTRDLVVPPAMVVTNFDQIMAEVRHSAIALLENARLKLKEQDIVADYLYKQGSSISRVVVEVAQKQGTDLIIIGSRGLGNIKGMMLAVPLCNRFLDFNYI